MSGEFQDRNSDDLVSSWHKDPAGQQTSLGRGNGTVALYANSFPNRDLPATRGIYVGTFREDDE